MTDEPSPDHARLEANRREWQRDYDAQIGPTKTLVNRSGIEVRPLYSPLDWDCTRYAEDLGFPERPPFTRGIYATMHRGRTWSQRQLIGLGTPDEYNQRVRALLAAGATAISLLPCNSGFRGIDCDEAPEPLLGTCGTVLNNIEHMDRCLTGVPFERVSTALNDPTPFTLLAFLLAVARQRGIGWESLTGTSNQSDYLSHYVANHMFFRLALPGARRILVDHIAFCRDRVPRWNPVSVVGQHMQQAGATPAQTMGFTLSTAIQYARDCRDRGLDLNSVLPRFTFFFDISISFFEEIAKFRAGRRIWARIAKNQLGTTDPRAWRFKFHGQTSGADLTRQQPLNNIARVTTQAIAGILSGLQSMHTDAYDEAIACPTEEAARIAVATQNILRDEARLCDVIDPLGGSYYIETLTNEMEAEIEKVIETVESAGGMYEAVNKGIVQRAIGESALAAQARIESGEQTIVGVNRYRGEEEACVEPRPFRPDRRAISEQIRTFREFKASRSQSVVSRALRDLGTVCHDSQANLFEAVVRGAGTGLTHGEIIGCLRAELGFGHPLIVP